MNPQDTPEFLNAEVDQLVASMHDLRDALVEVSLFLKDRRLDAEPELRNEAAKHLDELLNKVKNL